MAITNWVVTEGTRKIMEGTEQEVLSLIQEHDPFISLLRDGLKVDGLLISRIDAEPIERTESEKALRAFTASIHKQIHDAADAAFRSEENKSRHLLKIIEERVIHFNKNHN